MDDKKIKIKEELINTRKVMRKKVLDLQRVYIYQMTEQSKILKPLVDPLESII